MSSFSENYKGFVGGNRVISSKDILRNKIKSIIIYTLRSVTLMCASGTLIQTFLSVLGFESRLIYIHSTLLQMTSVLSIMLCSRWADKGNIIKRAAFIFLTQFAQALRE